LSFEGKWATFVEKYFQYDIARSRGIAKKKQIVFFLDEISIKRGVSIGFAKGSPILALFLQIPFW
jgi:hypothetical protein